MTVWGRRWTSVVAAEIGLSQIGVARRFARRRTPLSAAYLQHELHGWIQA
jgi:hypothetical protein